MIKKSGFSLIELLVVVTVIALLMSAGAYTYSHQVSRGRDQKRMADLGYIQTALEKYKSDNGAYPNKLNAIEGSYIEKLPVDPKTRANYDYTVVKKNSMIEGCGGRELTCGGDNVDYCAYVLRAYLESGGSENIYELCSL